MAIHVDMEADLPTDIGMPDLAVPDMEDDASESDMGEPSGPPYSIQVTYPTSIPALEDVPLRVHVPFATTGITRLTSPAVQGMDLSTELSIQTNSYLSFWVLWPGLNSVETTEYFTISEAAMPSPDPALWNDFYGVWHMSTGRLLDSTVGQRSFTCMDGSQMCVAPSAHIDGAIQLQSVSLQTENIDVDSDWTLMFWFKAGVGQRPLLSFRRDEANLVTLFVNGEDRLILRVRKGTLGQPFFNEDKDLSTIDLNAWHHLTIRASNNRVTYSLNGASFLDAGNDPMEAQAARIILGAPSSEAHFDEVWLGKVETDAALTIYRNQSGALEPEVTRVP